MMVIKKIKVKKFTRQEWCRIWSRRTDGKPAIKKVTIEKGYKMGKSYFFNYYAVKRS